MHTTCLENSSSLRRPGAKNKGGGLLLGTGPLPRDAENLRSFAVRLEAQRWDGWIAVVGWFWLQLLGDFMGYHGDIMDAKEDIDGIYIYRIDPNGYFDAGI